MIQVFRLLARTTRYAVIGGAGVLVTKREQTSDSVALMERDSGEAATGVVAGLEAALDWREPGAHPLISRGFILGASEPNGEYANCVSARVPSGLVAALGGRAASAADDSWRRLRTEVTLCGGNARVDLEVVLDGVAWCRLISRLSSALLNRARGRFV
jgi:hypothetical protein